MDPLVIFRTWLETISAGALFAFLIRVTLVCAAGQLALVLLRNAPAAVRHLAATAALATLLLAPLLFALLPAWPALRIPIAPPRAEVAFASSSLGRQWNGAGGEEATTRVPATPRPDARREAPRTARSTFAVLADAARIAIARTTAPVTVPLRLPGGFALLVLAVSEFLLLLIGLSSICAAWLARRAQPVDLADVRAEVSAACRRVGLVEDVPLRVSDRLSVPVVVGIRRPRLLLPLVALDWPAERRQAVLVHELAHVARRDGIAQLIARLATALYWFHPLAWTLARVAHDECERAADDTVLRTGVRASDYAEHLLAVARDAMRAPLPHAALAFARPSSLEARLVAILKRDARRDPAARQGYLWATLAVAAFVLPLTSLRVVASPRSGERVATAPKRTAPPRFARTASMRVVATGTVSETRSNCEEMTSEAKQTSCTSDTKTSSSTVSAAGFEKRSTQSNSASGEKWYDLAKEHYDAERYVDAAEAYEDAARSGYRQDTAWYNSACSWSLAGRRDAALGALLQSIDAGFDDLDQIQSDSDLDAIRADGRYQLVLERAMHSDKGEQKRAAARSEFDALRTSGERDAGEWRAAGLSLLRSDEPDRAAQAFEAEVALDSSASGTYNLACAQASGNHPTAALATLERAVLMGYGDRKEIASDADLNSLHGEPGFERTLRLAEDLALFSNGRGDDDTPAWRRDLPRFERVTREHPAAGRAWFNLGYAQLRVTDLDGSARSFTRALELGHRVGTTSYNLACVAARQGDVDGAFRWLERAEQAGMEVGGSVRTDADLAEIHSDARYRALIDRWNAAHGKSESEKVKLEKDKRREKLARAREAGR
jgi:beta-lactamase regulating signal transducer with metallopeptidase domain